jgi:hypothetical protein
MTTDEIVTLLAVTLEGLGRDLRGRDTRTARTHAAQLLAALDRFDVSHPGLPAPGLAAEATAAIWLMRVSVSDLDAAISEETPDWEKIDGAFSLAESGMRQLADSLKDRR